MKLYRTFFGRNIGTSGTIVSDRQFETFLRDTVDLLLDGYTTIDGVGRWRGTDEYTTIIEACDEADELRWKVFQIVKAYKERFNRESVQVQEINCGVTFT